MELLQQIRQSMKLYTTGMTGGSTLPFFSPDHPACFVFGNEANGVDEAIQQAADDIINIPMSGRMESLNVAVSAGIVMWEIWRNRKKC